MDPWSSYSLYGGTPPPQPTSTGTVDHPPGTPEPRVRTVARAGGLSPQHNPTFLLVAMLGIAAVLVMRIHGHFD